jgi:hypothetical protein
MRFPLGTPSESPARSTERRNTVTKLLTRLPGTDGIDATLPFPTSSTPGI